MKRIRRRVISITSTVYVLTYICFKIPTHSFKTRFQSKITRQLLSLYPEQVESNDFYSNSFEELCTWLLSILQVRYVVSMQDVTETV